MSEGAMHVTMHTFPSLSPQEHLGAATPVLHKRDRRGPWCGLVRAGTSCDVQRTMGTCQRDPGFSKDQQAPEGLCKTLAIREMQIKPQRDTTSHPIERP